MIFCAEIQITKFKSGGILSRNRLPSPQDISQNTPRCMPIWGTVELSGELTLYHCSLTLQAQSSEVATSDREPEYNFFFKKIFVTQKLPIHLSNLKVTNYGSTH